MDTTTYATERAAILGALAGWIRQRPGLEYGNYGDPTAYRAEVRRIGRHLADARALLRYVEPRDTISADVLRESFRRAFSGRLTVTTTETPDGWTATLDYCTGQYWPTEYRAAVCAVLGIAVHAYLRDGIPAHTDRPGDAIRKLARSEPGASIQRRWID